MSRARNETILMGMVLLLCLAGGHASADVRNAAPVQGSIHYAIPIVAVLGFGLFGLLCLGFAFTCPRYVRPFVLVGASGCILAQYLGIMIDLGQYEGVFVWYDAFLLPPYCLFLPEAYTDFGHFLGLVVPCAFIIASTVAIPASWAYHKWLLASEERDAVRFAAAERARERKG